MLLSRATLFLGFTALLAVGGCSSAKETRLADCVKLEKAMEQFRKDREMFPDWFDRIAADVRAVQPELEDDRVAELADDVARTLEARAEYERAHPEVRDGEPAADVQWRDRELEDEFLTAATEVSKLCGPLRARTPDGFE
ncbi:hypothetical protein [Actinomadura sp. WAC 06369]|uniref:hypothetical protein n=1 Tax=Actinomadura sp. WAC 06369 TaxID=2203193 RepID=UPI000F7B9E1D|nr:hypothetical protein [Actinomadura sp. WAC 06369]RSN56671.1 hypothetical protein DMH08_24950 [Actinomadura sp. WAC 06369]